MNTNIEIHKQDKINFLETIFLIGIHILWTCMLATAVFVFFYYIYTFIRDVIF